MECRRCVGEEKDRIENGEQHGELVEGFEKGRHASCPKIANAPKRRQAY